MDELLRHCQTKGAETDRLTPKILRQFSTLPISLTIDRALMGNPEPILLDEPVEGLTPLVVKDFAERLLTLKEIVVTILFSE